MMIAHSIPGVKIRSCDKNDTKGVGGAVRIGTDRNGSMRRAGAIPSGDRHWVGQVQKEYTYSCVLPTVLVFRDGTVIRMGFVHTSLESSCSTVRLTMRHPFAHRNNNNENNNDHNNDNNIDRAELCQGGGGGGGGSSSGSSQMSMGISLGIGATVVRNKKKTRERYSVQAT